MNQAFMENKFINLGGLNFLIKKEHLAKDFVGKDMNQLIFGPAFINNFVHEEKADKILSKGLVEIAAIFNHGLIILNPKWGHKPFSN